MAFRDINPAPMNPLAYAEMAAAPAQNFLAGQQQGMDAELVRRSVARDDATAAALAGYYEAPPDQRGAALNTLAGIDPSQAGQVMQLQQAQAAQAAEQRRAQAVDAHARASHVLRSENPALALKLLDTEGALIQQLEQAGVINSADGFSDDEAREVAQYVVDTMGPIAGAGDERAEPAAIREMRELGYAMTPEGFAEYNASKGTGQGDPMAALLAQAQLDQRRVELAREEREAAEATRTAAVDREKQRSANRRVIEQTGHIADQAQSLQGTLLEVGAPGADIRRAVSGVAAGAGSMLGLDTAGARKVNDTYDKLKKNTADQLINLMGSGDLGQGTNNKLAQYQSALASTETSLGAILSIQANIAEIALEQADAEGFEVENREAVEQRIAELRGYTTPAGDPAVDVPALSRRIGEISRMGVDELRALQSGASELTDEMLEAAAQRWDELNAAPQR